MDSYTEVYNVVTMWVCEINVDEDKKKINWRVFRPYPFPR